MHRTWPRRTNVFAMFNGTRKSAAPSRRRGFRKYHASRGEWEAGIPWARKAWEINRRVHGDESRQATADAVALAGRVDHQQDSRWPVRHQLACPGAVLSASRAIWVWQSGQ